MSMLNLNTYIYIYIHIFKEDLKNRPRVMNTFLYNFEDKMVMSTLNLKLHEVTAEE